jgi:hypothetical protein
LVIAAGEGQTASVDRVIADLAGVGDGGPDWNAGGDSGECIADGNAAHAAGKTAGLFADSDRLVGCGVVKRRDGDIRTGSGGRVLQAVIGRIDTTKRNARDVDGLGGADILGDEICCLAVGQRVASHLVGRAANDGCRCRAVVRLIAAGIGDSEILRRDIGGRRRRRPGQCVIACVDTPKRDANDIDGLAGGDILVGEVRGLIVGQRVAANDIGRCA